jgi:Skp family chaperone for outer membrane proteins
MNKIAILAATAAALVVAAPAAAQAVPAAVIGVVDLGRVSSQCTACRAANVALQGQMSASRTRLQTLASSIEAEGKTLQAAIDAVPQGKEPDAALQTRVRAFQAKQQQFAQERQSREEQLQRNNAYVSQQIITKLGPIYAQVAQRRGASLIVDQGSTLYSASNLDVTNDVLTALNAALPSVATTAPAAPAAAAPRQQPQGR